MEGFVPPVLQLDEDSLGVREETADQTEETTKKKEWTPRVRALSPREQGRKTPAGFKPTWDKPLAAVRCTGTIRNGERKGEQCGRWALIGAIVCNSHGARLPSVQKSAERRIKEMRMYIIGEADRAVDTLFDLLDDKNGEQVRLGAAKEIMSIVGVKDNSVSIEVEHRVSPSSIINERLDKLAKNNHAEKAEELIDEGEVVEDEVVDPSLEVDGKDV